MDKSAIDHANIEILRLERAVDQTACLGIAIRFIVDPSLK